MSDEDWGFVIGASNTFAASRLSLPSGAGNTIRFAPGIGEFSASYEATLTPGSTSEWTIRHNLGVVPKCVIIEMAGEPSMTNYAVRAIYELDMLETQGGNTGFGV